MTHPYEQKMAAIRETAADLNPMPLRELADDLYRLADAREAATTMAEEAHRDTLRIAAMAGLEAQIQRLTKHNAVDKEDLVTDIKRAINYLRNEK
jgi:hypothetical protein